MSQNFSSAGDLHPIGLGFAQMNHSIDYATSDARVGLLPFPGAGSQLRPQDALIAGHAGLGQTPFMISPVPFPSFSSQTQDGLHPLVARFNRSIASLGGAQVGIALGRNHRFDGGRPRRGWIGQGGFNFQVHDL